MTRLLLAPLLALAWAAAYTPAAAQGTGAQPGGNLASLFSNGDYPAEAIRTRQQGTVAFELTAGVDGRVTGCRITGSSGSSLLDSTTCGILVRRARFKPARDASGKPVPDTFNGRIVWRLPETGPPPAETLPPPPEQNAAAAAFKQLSALVGIWRNAEAPNSPLSIRFFLTAGGTTLVESWERAGAPHSLTLYHRDGGTLVATHYCPQGNQPRLALSPMAGPGLHFTFRDATDLDAGESHLHDLSFNLTDPARPVRSEIYRQGASAERSLS